MSDRSAPSETDAPSLDPADAALAGVATAFASLGRQLVCVGRDFRIVHVSPGVRDLLGDRPAPIGRPVSELLGVGLFEPGGRMRRALESGLRREGWRALLDPDGEYPRRVSISAAPLRHDPGSACDPRVAYLVVLRPVEDVQEVGGGDPTMFAGIIARSPAMVRIFELIESLHESDATVLISGESGTGKELVARALHAHSPRRDGRFVAVNCGAVPSELLESEMFGHVRGAFTGAIRDRVGRFELARGGTLFLDEIGDIPLPMQVKLLRVLQERTYEPVGESRSKAADVRVIAATNVDLEQAIGDGRFRDDLYYRLRVIPIEIPALRQRPEDLEPLSRYLLARVNARYGRSVRFSPDIFGVLRRHTWPGNIRELENALEYAMTSCRSETIHPEHLPPGIGDTEPPRRSTGSNESSRDSDEASRLRAVLDQHHWKREEAARSLGISRTTLWRRMRELGLMEP